MYPDLSMNLVFCDMWYFLYSLTTENIDHDFICFLSIDSGCSKCRE